MVAKKKALAKASGVIKAAVNKTKGVAKIRLGVCVGKDFDPCKKDHHMANFPKKLILTEEDWGKYGIDANTALRMQELHEDLLDIDIIPTEEVSCERLKKNHLNLSFWPEVGVAMRTGNKKLVAEYYKVQKDPDCRFAPSWDEYDWVVDKTRYMQQCEKAGIPMIPTVYYKNGFDAKQCLKDVKAKGWEKFLCKVGQYTFFGEGVVHGKTADFEGKRWKDLEKYAKDTKKSKLFLVQPYTLKPNGEVFDEVRNFFIDGEWRYSVFTHGTDESDDGYYQEPDGPRKEACKALAIRAYQEVLKSSIWQGKQQTPLLNRIDIGVIPKKGACSLHKKDNQYFLNEIEMICTTWLDRYSPINVTEVMAHASVKHSVELLVGMLNAKTNVPDKENVRKVVEILNTKLDLKLKINK